MCVDGNNRLCNKKTYFYDNGEVLLKPILKSDNFQIWMVGDYVTAIGRMFLAFIYGLLSFEGDDQKTIDLPLLPHVSSIPSKAITIRFLKKKF